MSQPSAAQRRWAEGTTGIPGRCCPVGCGARFFTTVGVEEHTRLGCGNGHGSPVSCRRALPSAKQRAAWVATGQQVTALNNSRRVRCDECEKVSTPSGIGSHQHFTGHVGRTEQ